MFTDLHFKKFAVSRRFFGMRVLAIAKAKRLSQINLNFRRRKKIFQMKGKELKDVEIALFFQSLKMC